MNTNQQSPVQRTRNAQYWLNLALAGLLLFYIMYAAWQVITPTMMCTQIANDYCEYIRGGTRANAQDFAWINEWRLQKRVPLSGAEWTGILPYPPVFTVPFQLLALLKPEVSFWIWIAINIAAMFFYLRFFVRRLQLQPMPARLMIMAFASLPVFLNLLAGQVDVWLMICVGELLRALIEHKPFKAGVWIGGLLLKPQMLILIGILLLLQRAWRILAGLMASSVGLVFVSFLLVGPGGLLRVLLSWTQAARVPVGEWAEGMMNWRMIYIHLSNITNPWIGGAVAAVGMLVITGLSFYVWRRPFYPAPAEAISVEILGVLTATALVSWHSHIHMAMILIPPILYLYLTGRLSLKVVEIWFMMPALLFVAMVFIPETMMHFNIIPLSARVFIYFLLGASEFSLNLFLFSWAWDKSRQSYRSPGDEYWLASSSETVNPG